MVTIQISLYFSNMSIAEVDFKKMCSLESISIVSWSSRIISDVLTDEQKAKFFSFEEQIFDGL